MVKTGIDAVELTFIAGNRVGSFKSQQSGLSVKQGGTADFDSSLPWAESFFVQTKKLRRMAIVNI